MAVTNLIITGGINHPFDVSAAALARVLGAVGIESSITEDVDAGLVAVGRREYSLVTIYTLRWRMLDDEKYAPFRDRWAYTIDAAGRSAIEQHVHGGGALLGLHTASLCFDTWPGWRDLLGAAWRWGRSFHPPLASLTVRPDTATHPITLGLPAFDLIDEIYHYLDTSADAQPLLWAGDQPVAWAREAAGRVVYDALGHDAASLEQSDHARFLQRAALWALRRPDIDVAAV